MDIPEEEQPDYNMDEWDGSKTILFRFALITPLVTIPKNNIDDEWNEEPPK